LPFEGDVYRVFGEDRLFIVFTLVKTNALTTPEINSRYYLDLILPLVLFAASLLEIVYPLSPDPFTS
jgi:hypothetical protein